MKAIDTWGKKLVSSIETVFYGKRGVIEKLLVSILAGGHVLLEDVPGVGKTILARAMAASIGGSFARIQCTPDLLPADVIGVSVFNPKDQSFSFRQGPIHSNIVLVDEVNRATPRTQAALLEAMGEEQVTVEGQKISLEQPFFVIATENPVEFEGTFPLPEAQKDRFLLSLRIGYPERNVEEYMLEAQRDTTHPVHHLNAVSSAEEVREQRERVAQVHVDESVRGYLMDLVAGTRNHHRVRVGISPRGSLALYACSRALAAVRGREYVTPDDIKEMTPYVFAHRLILNADAVSKGVTAESVVEEVLDSVRVPIQRDERS
jgi:MoxR-like ATPase